MGLTFLGAALGLAGCETPGPRSDTTTVQVFGPELAHVTGFYVQSGYRVPFDEPLPLTITHDGLTELQVFKTQPLGALTLAAQNDDNGWHSEAFNDAGDGVSGLRVRVDGGLYVDKLKVAP